jgi:hypothetical protein
MIPHHHNLGRPPAHGQTNLFTAPGGETQAPGKGKFFEMLQAHPPSSVLWKATGLRATV